MLPEQQLQHRGRVNELHRVAVVRPPERVHDGAGAIWREGGRNQLGRPEKVLWAAAADRRDHVRRVACVEPLHHLEDRPRMLQRGIDLREASRVELVAPARLVRVGLRLRVPAREQAGGFVEGVRLRDEERRVREQPDVLVVVPLARQDVVKQAAEERDVGAGANLDEAIGDGCRPVEAGIHAHELRVTVPPRFHDEPESHRVVFGRVAPHRQNDIRVADVRPAVGHRSSSERGGQTGHRGAVSYAGLLLDRHHAEAGAKCFHEQVVHLVGVGAAADHAQPRERVDGVAGCVLSRRNARRASA